VKQDPLALAFIGAALAVLAGLLLYVFVFKTPDPASAGSPGRAFDFVGVLRGKIGRVADQFRDKPAEKPAPRPSAQPAPKSSTPTVAASGPGIEAGRTWRYAVVVEPPAWRDITLTYRTQREGAGIGVLTDFVHAGGKMNFHLGTFAPNHPSHEDTRFPGFFMYAAYLKQPLVIGQPVAFGWHWQGKSAGSMKRFDGQVTAWEDVQLPAGKMSAAKIEGTLTYREDGQFRAGARETFWYAPRVSQVIRIVRDGRTPDEGSSRIVAELADYR
jgi:hypothetical protein